MKKLFLSFLAVAIAGTALFAQKTINDPNAEKRTVSGYHGIEVGTGIELNLTEGSSEEVAVSAATTEFRDKIVTKVENGILKIHYETKMGSINKKKESKNLKAYVSYKTLDLLHATTGAEVKINGVLKSSSLDMKANTGALVDGEVDITTLKVSQSTGSKITLSGKAEKLEIDGDTGSKFKGEDMSTSNCNVTVSTGAIVSVKAEKELQAKANTGGVIKYKGNATIKDIKTNTGGSVTRI
ncbi:MAG: head GIN domain-containing protein [Chitinophagaceae bacterium]